MTKKIARSLNRQEHKKMIGIGKEYFECCKRIPGMQKSFAWSCAMMRMHQSYIRFKHDGRIW